MTSTSTGQNTAKLTITVQIDLTKDDGKNDRTIHNYCYQIKPSEWLTLRNKLDQMNQLPTRPDTRKS